MRSNHRGFTVVALFGVLFRELPGVGGFSGCLGSQQGDQEDELHGVPHLRVRWGFRIRVGAEIVEYLGIEQAFAGQGRLGRSEGAVAMGVGSGSAGTGRRLASR